MPNQVSTERGHPLWMEADPTGKVEWENRTFHYISDDGICDKDHRRPCRRCGKAPLAGGEDACLGHIPGVTGACCGHGVDDPYIATAYGYSFALRGMYTSFDKTEVWEPLVPKISDDPKDHPIINGYVWLYQDKDHGNIWTSVDPIATMTYKADVPRDVPWDETDLIQVVIDLSFNNSSKCAIKIPSVPEALAMSKVLLMTGIEYVSPFYTTQRWAGFIPVLVENDHGCEAIVTRYPFDINDFRIIVSTYDSKDPPELKLPNIPETYLRPRNPESSYH